MASLADSPKRHKQKGRVTPVQVFLGDTIMKNRATKIAAAAAVIIVALIGIIQFGDSIGGTSVAFGDVLEYIQTSSYTFDLTVVTEEQAATTVQAMVLEPGRMRVDATLEAAGTISWIVDTMQGESRLLLHNNRTAYKWIAPGESAQVGGILVLCTRPVENLWDLRDGTEKRLGRKKINGQIAEGFEVHQKDLYFQHEITIWADAETAAPVLVEIVSTSLEDSPKSVQFTMDNFNLDTELDKELFSFEVPPGYTLAHQKTLREAVTDTESTAEAQKIEHSLALWSNGQENESVQTLLSIDWTKPIEFSDKMYLFSLTEKGYVALRPQDQQQVLKEITEALQQIKGLVRKLSELAEIARTNRDYLKAESCLETTLNLGRLVNRNPEGILLSRSFGLSVQRKSLDEMKLLYQQMNQQDKVRQVEEEIRKVDKRRESFLRGLKSKFGGQ
jgi:outer membrane lipoprotein-sorting protein